MEISDVMAVPKQSSTVCLTSPNSGWLFGSIRSNKQHISVSYEMKTINCQKVQLRVNKKTDITAHQQDQQAPVSKPNSET